jgi:hypothetical protein
MRSLARLHVDPAALTPPLATLTRFRLGIVCLSIAGAACLTLAITRATSITGTASVQMAGTTTARHTIVVRTHPGIGLREEAACRSRRGCGGEHLFAVLAVLGASSDGRTAWVGRCSITARRSGFYSGSDCGRGVACCQARQRRANSKRWPTSNDASSSGERSISRPFQGMV